MALIGGVIQYVYRKSFGFQVEAQSWTQHCVTLYEPFNHYFHIRKLGIIIPTYQVDKKSRKECI